MKRIAVNSAFILFVAVMLFAETLSAAEAEGKILYVDSYHEGYPWSDSITQGIRSVLAGTDVELKIFRMDTKRNTGKNFMRKRAMEAKMLIEEFQPDVIIASDDNASKYLIKPFYVNAEIPVLFCAVNWDASMYGFPCRNVTGMVEVAPYPKLMEFVGQLSKGDKLAYLAADVNTARKDGVYYRKLFQAEFDEFYAQTLQEWSALYAELQENYDLLLVGNSAGIDGWDDEKAEVVVLDKSKIPSGTFNEHMVHFALFGYVKLGEEQGAWAAEAALSILNGADVSAIPVTTNKRGKLFLHAGLVEAMQLTIPEAILQQVDENIR